MSGEDQGGAGRREVAYRLFAAEFEDADFSYSESDEERAPNYVVTPTGARVNRLFVVGVLTEVEEAGEDILRARVVDPTGAFVVYAGQYQPEAQAFYDRAEPPMFVAVTGKARTFQPEDSEVTYTSVRPENVNEVSAETRDRWNVQAARQTIDRVSTAANALAREERGEDLRRALEAEGVDAGLAAGVPLAIDHYGTTAAYLGAVRDLAVQVAEVVAGERDEVDPFVADPDLPGEVDPASLGALDVPGGTEPMVASDVGGESPAASDASGESAAASDAGGESTAASDAGGESTTSGESGDSGTDAGSAGGDVGDFEPGDFEMDDEEREAIEAEHGTDFKPGTEVGEPGEAGIETPDDGADETAASEAAETPPADADGTAEVGDVEEGDVEEEPADVEEEPADVEEEEPADVDVETAVMDAMRELDAGDGAPEDAIVADVTDRLGVDEAVVTDALQDALMGGQCYEPEDGVYKPI